MAQRDADAYDAVKAALELPMALLAFVLAGLLVIPEVVALSDVTAQRLDLVGWLLWAVFAFEYLVLLWLAPQRMRMVREHPLELLLLILPFLRPARALRFVRVFASATASLGMIRAMLARRGLQWFFVFVLLVVAAGGCLTLAAERHAEHAQISDLGQALWWAIVTCTTVGYGDYAPVTPMGRAIATVLMLVGISVVSVVTANIASFFVEKEVEEDTVRLESQLAVIQSRLDELVGALSAALPSTLAGDEEQLQPKNAQRTSSADTTSAAPTYQ